MHETTMTVPGTTIIGTVIISMTDAGEKASRSSWFVLEFSDFSKHWASRSLLVLATQLVEKV